MKENIKSTGREESSRTSPHLILITEVGGLYPGKDAMLQVIVVKLPEAFPEDHMALRNTTALEQSTTLEVTSNASGKHLQEKNIGTIRPTPQHASAGSETNSDRRINMAILKEEARVWFHQPKYTNPKQYELKPTKYEVGDIISVPPGCGIYVQRGAIAVLAVAINFHAEAMSQAGRGQSLGP